MSALIADQQTATAGPRLDSWKEIAAYLKRGGRTVRRWERLEGLPVHRHRHGKQATVYAFPREIDTWLEHRSVDQSGALPVDHLPQRTARRVSAQQQKERGARPAVIAVLPLRSFDDSPDQERFADGLTQELISEIGRCCPKRLRVIALTSVMQYKQSPKNIAQIGQELGADYILEGGIRRYGRRVRLTARLIAASDQAHLWQDSYEIQLPPIFSLQQGLAHEVVDSLSGVFRMTPRRRLRLTVPRSPEAHDAYLEARSHFLLNEGDSKKSIEQLNISIERDPKFAPSYADLALAYFRRLYWNFPPIVTMKRVEEYASIAMKLDPRLARARSLLAAFYLFGARDWSKADRSSRRSTKLNPSDPWAWLIRAAYHLAVGEPHQATEALVRMRQLDPQSVETGIWFAFFAYYARRHDLAIDHSREILRLDPSSALAHTVLALNLVQTGERAAAIAHCEKAIELGDNSIWLLTRLCSVYASAGEPEAAERLFQQIVTAKDTEYTRYIFLAQASSSLGKDQQTLEWLEKAYEQREPLLVFLKADLRFDRLSEDASFRNLLRRIGLPSEPRRLASARRAS